MSGRIWIWWCLRGFIQVIRKTSVVQLTSKHFIPNLLLLGATKKWRWKGAKSSIRARWSPGFKYSNSKCSLFMEWQVTFVEESLFCSSSGIIYIYIYISITFSVQCVPASPNLWPEKCTQSTFLHEPKSVQLSSSDHFSFSWSIDTLLLLPHSFLAARCLASQSAEKASAFHYHHHYVHLLFGREEGWIICLKHDHLYVIWIVKWGKQKSGKKERWGSLIFLFPIPAVNDFHILTTDMSCCFIWFSLVIILLRRSSIVSRDSLLLLI